MISLDTNILIYSISPDPDDAMKRGVSEDLLDRNDCLLSMQVLNEFVHQATRKTRPWRLSRERAIRLTETWRRFPVLPIDNIVFELASTHFQRENYSWWDCLIVAAAIVSGCDTLATEDLQHGRVIDGVRIVNPFPELA